MQHDAGGLAIALAIMGQQMQDMNKGLQRSGVSLLEMWFERMTLSGSAEGKFPNEWNR